MTKDFTINEKYQQGKDQAIAIRPYFDDQKENMGLEKYGMTLHDGVYHQEDLACLELNGIKRYVTGLNEFAPDVKMLPDAEKKAKIKEIRKVIIQLEKELAANVLDEKDPEFWNKVQVLRPDNHKFWGKIHIKVGNDPYFLDPKKDPYDLIKLYAIKAGGFSIVAKDYETAQSIPNCRFYLDQVKKTVNTRTKTSKVKNKALAMLQKLYDENQDKLFYVTKMIDAHSYEYVRSTPIDVLYENMDAYINGLGDEKSTTTAASTFIAVANDSMENLTLRTLIKDSTYYQFMTNDNRGWIIESETKVKLGKSNEEILEFFKNPLNEEILDRMLSQVKNYWES
tara:strand:- start:1050 stop:2066 length:1017 start_codon:yes stop_codon:yes gene_type:complete